MYCTCMSMLLLHVVVNFQEKFFGNKLVNLILESCAHLYMCVCTISNLKNFNALLLSIVYVIPV